MKITVLDGGILNPGDVSWAPLEAFGNLEVHYDTTPDEVEARVKGADVVLVNKVELRESDLPALKSCGLVGALATGVDNLDVEALGKAGIDVCNVPNYGVEDVAQHAIALLLEICRDVGLHAQSVRNGEWKGEGNWCYWLKSPICLYDQTMGIVGFGSIGRAVGRIANALGMKVIASTRSRTNAPQYAPFRFVELEELLERADVISLHCPLTPQTDKLVNTRSIAKMRKGAIVINTARGGLVDDAAVAKALESGQLRGYGADVVSTEPPAPDNPLLTAPNCYITPHLAWVTPTARQRIIDIMASNIKSWKSGELANRVGRKVS